MGQGSSSEHYNRPIYSRHNRLPRRRSLGSHHSISRSSEVSIAGESQSSDTVVNSNTNSSSGNNNHIVIHANRDETQPFTARASTSRSMSSHSSQFIVPHIEAGFMSTPSSTSRFNARRRLQNSLHSNIGGGSGSSNSSSVAGSTQVASAHNRLSDNLSPLSRELEDFTMKETVPSRTSSFDIGSATGLTLREEASRRKNDLLNQSDLAQHQQTQTRSQERTNSALFMEEPPSLMSMGEVLDLSDECLQQAPSPSGEIYQSNTGTIRSNKSNMKMSRIENNIMFDDLMPPQQQFAESNAETTTTSSSDNQQQNAYSAAGVMPLSSADEQQHDSLSSPLSIRATTTRTSNLATSYDPRRGSVCSEATGSTVSDFDDDDGGLYSSQSVTIGSHDFYPQASRNYEWMGRSIESLLLGHVSRAPILQLLEDEEAEEAAADFYAVRRRSTASTFGGGVFGRRRSSHGSFPGGRRGSLSLSGGSNVHGGTLANYYSRRRGQVPTDVDRSYNERQGRRGSTSHTPMYRRRSSVTTTGVDDAAVTNTSGSRSPSNRSSKGGPNVILSLMARENTGKSCFARDVPGTQCLRAMGGHALFLALDRPAAGMATEVAFLAAAIDTGDWTETQTIISRLAPRLVGDPMAAAAAAAAAVAVHGDRGATTGSTAANTVQDPNVPPTAPRFYAGGGRTGLERDAFVQAGGVVVLLRVFREKSFVGQEMAYSYDARDLSSEIVATRFAQCWNEALVSLRELVYSIPSLVEDRKISDSGEFLPFLFTLLSHDSCFDSAAALIEEILALSTQSPQPQPSSEAEGGVAGASVPNFQPIGRLSSPSTFFLGNVPDLYKLWSDFSCRQLAHFCRILALLIFEPEDRQLLDNPAILKSLELLLLRRNRAVRAGRDSTVDMNQSILVGDEELLRRLLQLLRVMNFSPPLRRVTPYHVMAQHPFIGDTLVMLGLSEFDDWGEIDRQEKLARRLLEEDAMEIEESGEEGRVDVEGLAAAASTNKRLLGELGNVATMLEGLSETLGESSNQIGHIIQVISAAQQAGVIVGRSSRNNNSNSRRGVRNRRPINSNNNRAPLASILGIAPSEEDQETATAALRLGGISVDTATIQGLASVAGILTDQVLVRRLYQTSTEDGDNLFGTGFDEDGNSVTRHFINTPEDAANSMQFNGMLLGPYQVEVLFVLCTLLGGRRKLDAQDILRRLGIVPVLHDMFQRLPWYKKERHLDDGSRASEYETIPAVLTASSDAQSNGIHGPGCECTPESALCIQYLRLLHNFCDRDCDNYKGRRLLLSNVERRYIFNGGSYPNKPEEKGLLTNTIQAFIEEPDDSPYRFWLASCIESYLRGSSPEEQMFAAQSGLMNHLIADVSSDRLHCAGSLQTSFDLLGELGKGNPNVIRLLVNDLDEESFRKLMSVAAANLVDSNVFIRSLLLSLERLAAAEQSLPLYNISTTDINNVVSEVSSWTSQTGSMSRAYLTHSWWDTQSYSLDQSTVVSCSDEDDLHDESRPADWFPSRDILEARDVTTHNFTAVPLGLQESVGHFGWLFTPSGNSLTSNTYRPNSLERLSWFLAANQARLLRDLLGVVDLRNINHENICCLNTAVVIAIFAHRRRQLPSLLNELRQMNDEEKESKRRALDAARHDDVVDRAFVQAMRYMDLDNQRETPNYARRRSLTNNNSSSFNSSSQQIGDRADVVRNFREVLWFWTEYYTHRGRDRLSLEFSSHIRFQEWNHVVSLLSADDGSSTSLICSYLRLPRSPYQRAARVADSPIRGI